MTGKVSGNIPSFDRSHPLVGKEDSLHAMNELQSADSIQVRMQQGAGEPPSWTEYTSGQSDPAIGSYLATVLKSLTKARQGDIKRLISNDVVAALASESKKIGHER